jgi:type IV pilus assembly protein PilY1
MEMNKHSILHAVAAAALVTLAGAPGAVFSDDAEIYVNNRDLPEESQPLVMFSLDYRSNLSSRVCLNGECQFLVEAGLLPPGEASYSFFEMLRASLQLVLAPLSGVRIGLMLNHADQNNCEGPAGIRASCANGGYIAMGFRELQQGDANGAKAMFNSALATMPPIVSGGGPDPSHPYQGRELFYEFYRYLTGASVYNGYNGFKSYDGNTGNNAINIVPEYSARWADTPSAPVNGFSWDPTIVQGAQVLDAATGTYSTVGNYISPLTALGDCSKIFTVNFMFQVSQQESHSNAEIAGDIGLASSCQGPGCDFAKMIEYLNRTDLAPGVEGDQKVISYFLGTEPQVRNNTFAAYATAGGSGSALPITDDPRDLVDTLNDVFKQILSISTTFTAAALPVNSFDRAQVLSDVFLALFQPQVNDFPQNNSYWWGNIKKLKLTGLETTGEAVQLVDARDQPAVAADGRLRFDALTFWTDPNAADVLDPGRDPDGNAVSGRDGRSVNRGGGGHKKPGYPRYVDHNPGRQNPASNPVPEGPRRMFYDSGDSSLASLEATDAVAASLQSAIGAADQTEAFEILKFMRGLIPIADTPEDVPLDWMFGAVMHSRPVPVNYGARDGHTTDNPMIYVAAGGNDGALRFIRNTDSSGNEIGQEAWSFTPTEVMANVRRIVRQEGPEFSGDSTIYGFDGPATLYMNDQNANGTVDPGDEAILYAGLRRGGRGYYALDVSNPEAPSLLWRIIGGVTPGFDNLGWAFSQPRTGRMNLGSGPVPVVIFAGGYDRAYDDETGAVPANPMGAGIYVVDGRTGALVHHVQHADMADSIPSTVAAVDTAGDGLVDRIYVGDLGGRIWRVDMTPAGTPDDWAVSMLADLGRHPEGGAPGSMHDRRFFNSPDVVQSRMLVSTGDATAEYVNFHAVLIGSGDRENPLYNTPNNWFFMIRDLNFGILSEAADTAYTLGDLTDVTTVSQVGAEIPSDSAGWALQLTTPGEKNLAPSLTVGGAVFFTTYIPPGAENSDVCGPSEGTGRLYAVRLDNADPVYRDLPVGEDGEPIDDGSFQPGDRWTDTLSPGIPAEAQYLPSSDGDPDCIMVGLGCQDFSTTSRWRTFWYLEEDRIQ